MEANHEVRDFARFLRRRLTLPEGLLWRALKGGKADGLKFRKQPPRWAVHSRLLLPRSPAVR